MSRLQDEYHIIYSSDITIENPHELSALCVFYDRVVLPHVAERDVGSITIQLSDTHLTYKALRTLSKGRLPPEQGLWATAQTWDEDNRVLFDEGVIVRLNPPPSGLENFEEDLFFDMDAEEQLLTLAKIKIWEIAQVEGDVILSLRPDIVRHLCRDDLRLPELHVCGLQPASREIMKFLEARSVFSYFIPELGELNKDQILKVREKVKDTREGFSLHLQTLSKGVEQRLKGGESISEIERFARSVIETELIPDYRQFLRQLSAEQGDFWQNVRKAVEKILKIDASPLTPKFWGQLLEAMGVALDTAERQKEQLSNRRQAFQFLKSVESSSVEGTTG
jgi:hypothetical protein